MSNALRYKSIIIFELKTTLIPILIYFAAVTVLNALGVTLVTVTTNSTTVQIGFDIVTSSVIFMAIASVQGFSDDFKLLIQNSFTRAEIFFSQTLFLVLLSLIISVVNLIYIRISRATSLLSITNVFEMIYGEYDAVSGFLLVFLFTLFIAGLSYMIAILFSRFNKKIVGFSLVILFVAVLTSFIFMPVDLTRKIVEAFLFAVGYTLESGTVTEVTTVNPIITLIILTDVWFGVSFLLLRKIEVKN